MADDLATAYTWHGICSRELGADPNSSFKTAASLWRLLLESTLSDPVADPGSLDRNAQHFQHTGRTASLLDALATLFGLVGQAPSERLVLELIEKMGTRVRTEGSILDTVAALSSEGNSMRTLGYLTAAEKRFARASKERGAESSHECVG